MKNIFVMVALVFGVALGVSAPEVARADGDWHPTTVLPFTDNGGWQPPPPAADDPFLADARDILRRREAARNQDFWFRWGIEACSHWGRMQQATSHNFVGQFAGSFARQFAANARAANYLADWEAAKGREPSFVEGFWLGVIAGL